MIGAITFRGVTWMGPRFVIAATSAGAVLVGLAASVSSLLAAIEHPVSAVSAQHMGELFASMPFLVLGIAGTALCTLGIPGRWLRIAAAAWALALLALCVLGPLAGPYGALFESATGWSAASWQSGWTQIAAWAGLGQEVTLGLARLPLAAGAVISLVLIGTEALGAGGLRSRLPVRQSIHVPLRRHGARGLVP